VFFMSTSVEESPCSSSWWSIWYASMYAHACCEKSRMRSMVRISLEKHYCTIALKFAFPLFIFKGCLWYKFFAHPQLRYSALLCISVFLCLLNELSASCPGTMLLYPTDCNWLTCSRTSIRSSSQSRDVSLSEALKRCFVSPESQ
jgi:hypothetical protein